jgi:hypothetical protein
LRFRFALVEGVAFPHVILGQALLPVERWRPPLARAVMTLNIVEEFGPERGRARLVTLALVVEEDVAFGAHDAPLGRK